MEETAWRLAGKLSDKEIKDIKSMFSIGRGLEKFDQAFLKQDDDSLNEFLAQANKFDNRVGLLESWFVRKEEEIKQRVNYPTPSLQKSDYLLHAYLEKHYKPAREKLVAKMLVADEFGNAKVEKEYKDLTAQELHELTEALCVRLNLFK